MTRTADQIAFAQLSFFRNMTVQTGKNISPELFDRIPAGQRNHIRWHLAHLWFVLERFVFHVGLHAYPQHDEHLKLYGNGSSPENWAGQEIPGAEDWLEKLAAQPARIAEALASQNIQVDQPLAEPFTFPNGYTVTTARELLNYGLFHEGMHLATIRSYVKQLQN